MKQHLLAYALVTFFLSATVALTVADALIGRCGLKRFGRPDRDSSIVVRVVNPPS